MLSRGTCIVYLWKILRQIFIFCIFTRIYIFKILYHEIMLNKKMNVAIIATLLLATTIIATPMKIANAQQQQQLPAPISQSGIKNVDQEITNRGWVSSSS